MRCHTMNRGFNFAGSRLARPAKSALAYFYEELTPQARALELIRGDYLLPSLAHRILPFAPWCV